MRVPAAALVIARRFEGLRFRVYLCPAGVPTIGYGTTRYPDGRRVTMKDPPIDKTTAEVFLRHDLGSCMNSALRLCPVLAAEPDGRVSAVADFVYNLGPGRLQSSTLRRRINARDWPGAARELRKWVRGGGRVLPGLVLRREAEIALLGLPTR
jgi:lysozyme